MRNLTALQKAKRDYFNSDPTGLSVVAKREDEYFHELWTAHNDAVKALNAQLMAGEDMHEVNRGSW